MRMIEKMIRAMQDTGLIDGMSEEDADTLATAALEALLEPTLKMSVTGMKWSAWASETFKDMINTALNE